MPTYEYACKSCGQHLEVVQSFKDDSLQTCPACGGQLRKVFGSIGIAFKGSGFYRNDSRTAASGADKSSDKTGSDKAGSDKAGSDKAASGSGSSSETSSSSGTGSSDRGSSDTGSSGGSGGSKGSKGESKAASGGAS